jgi:hypothetical protein
MSIDTDELATAASAALNEGEMIAIRIHEFELDGDEHDDDAIDKLHESFHADFATATAALTKIYGNPTRAASDIDDDAIPLCGVCRFAVWDFDRKGLFLAVSHEDRGTPILLMIGSTESRERKGHALRFGR